jgi:hypothetical protein
MLRDRTSMQSQLLAKQVDNSPVIIMQRQRHPAVVSGHRGWAHRIGDRPCCDVYLDLLLQQCSSA